MFKMCCSEGSEGVATISKAEEVIEAAKTIMRKKNLEKAREVMRKRREKMREE